MINEPFDSQAALLQRVRSLYSADLTGENLLWLYQIIQDRPSNAIVGAATAVLKEAGLSRELVEPSFLALLRSNNRLVRFSAVGCIRARNITERNSEIIDELILLLADDAEDVRAYTFFLLYDIDQQVLSNRLGKSIRSLTQCLDEVEAASIPERVRGIIGLSIFGQDGLTALIASDFRSNVLLRFAALLAISKCGRAAEPEIEKFLGDPSREIQGRAKWILSRR